MRKDVEVAAFTFDTSTRAVTGKHSVLSPQDLPPGCLGETGGFSSRRLADWIDRRAIPPTRLGIEPVLKRLGLTSPVELIDSGLAVSLSDQYWLRPLEAQVSWADVNFFTNDFPDDLGEAFVPRCPSSRERLQPIDREVAASSPDAALGGNLPKRWELRDGERLLVKSGKQSNLFAEPLCELAATRLCELILRPEDYVPYWVESYGWPEYVSICACMVDDHTELASAYDVIGSVRRSNDQSPYERYARLLEANGIADARTQLAKMLVVDHVIANFDRHWGNFGVFIDSDSRTWLRVAPIFDNGESLFCDQFASNRFTRYRSVRWMPFSHRIDQQLSRYVQDLDWLDEGRLLQYPEVLHDVLHTSTTMRSIPQRIDAVVEAVRTRIFEVLDHRDALSKRLF